MREESRKASTPQPIDFFSLSFFLFLLILLFLPSSYFIFFFLCLPLPFSSSSSSSSFFSLSFFPLLCFSSSPKRSLHSFYLFVFKIIAITHSHTSPPQPLLLHAQLTNYKQPTLLPFYPPAWIINESCTTRSFPSPSTRNIHSSNRCSNSSNNSNNISRTSRHINPYHSPSNL